MMNGTLTVTRGDHVAIHTHTAAETGWRATSHVIELASQRILADTPLLPAHTNEVLDHATELGKPITRAYISHAHPDPFAYAGLTTCRPTHRRRSRGSSTRPGRAIVGAYALTGHADLQPVSLPRIDRTVDAGEETIDSVRVSFEPAADAESGHQLTIGFPDDGILIAQDIVYNRVHACLGEQGSAPTSVDSLRWGRSGQAA